DVVETFVLGNAYAQQGDPLALQFASELERRGFRAEAHLMRGRSAWKAKDGKAAFAELSAGLDELRQGPLPLCDTAADTLGLLRRIVRATPALAPEIYAALQRGPLANYVQELNRRSVAQDIAFSLPDPQQCVTALGRELEIPRWQKDFLAARVS